MALSETYICLGGVLLLSQFLAFKLLGLLELGHWLNSSFIAFKNEYYYLLHLLVVLLQVLNIPWSWQSMLVAIQTNHLPYCLSDLDLKELFSHHHSHPCLRSTSQAIHASSFRSIQIKPSPNETNHTNVLLGLSQEKPRSLATLGNRMRLHM